MQELLTPVQFEPALDVLNQINKLSISHRARLSLDAMQACKNPVGHGNPIIGKFCREDNQGALCCKSDEKYSKYETQFIYNPGTTTRYSTMTFTNWVQGIMCWTTGYQPEYTKIYWAVPDGPKIMLCPFITWIYLPFVGHNIAFRSILLNSYTVLAFGIYL